MMKIAVLGAGMVGAAIALDLATDFQVTSFDYNQEALDRIHVRNNRIEIECRDLSDFSTYSQFLQPFDMLVIAVPGFMGYKALEAAIHAKKNIVDISFFPEDALQLDSLAKQKGITVVTDCGVAPGMSNLILGYHDAQQKINSFACYVGGLPCNPVPPFNYKAPFSPIDVIEEYTRPARLKENGIIKTRPALSEVEMLDFEQTGPLEAFNTDGLRSLLFTMDHIPDMKEKTLRYPGHVSLIQALSDAGFFSNNPLPKSGISPIEISSEILLQQWKLGEDEEEFTIMKVQLDTEEEVVEYLLYDRYDQASATSSMARTTGYTCTAVVRMLTEGLFVEKGLFPPELLGADPACFGFVLAKLKERNVNWVSNRTPKSKA